MAAPSLPLTLQYAKLPDGLLHRICLTKYASSEPGFFAAASGRFDDPLKTFKTLYCAATFDVCYAETLLRDRMNTATGIFEVPKSQHDARSLSLVLVDFSQLKIVDLYGPGLQMMGLDNSHTMAQYSETQLLSRALYEHAEAPDGMIYLSRFAPSHRQSIVLFDRAECHVRQLSSFPVTPLIQVPELFAALTQVQPIALV